jgi:hypothetical protein
MAATTLPSPEEYRGCLAETPHILSTALGPIEYAERGTGDPVLTIHGTLGGWDQGRGYGTGVCRELAAFPIGARCYQPRSFHSGRDPRSEPSVVPAP